MFLFSVLSMMVVGPTGVGKITLLNSLMCPARYLRTVSSKLTTL